MAKRLLDVLMALISIVEDDVAWFRSEMKVVSSDLRLPCADADMNPRALFEKAIRLLAKRRTVRSTQREARR